MPQTSPRRTIYRVLPVGGSWRIELAGDSFAEYAELKVEAIERAKALARRSPHGGVVVLDEEGAIETELELDRPPG